MYTLTPEIDDDWWEVEALFDLAFAPGREALSSYRLRDGVPALNDLGRIARDADGILAGAVRYWPVRIDHFDVVLLGPVAVHPTRQGEGLGGYLIRESLQAAKANGWSRAMLIGDHAYYSRFGFEKLSGVSMPPPTNPDRILGHALVPGAWDGVSGPIEKARA